LYSRFLTFFSMAQKVSPTFFRLKRRTSWCSKFSCHNSIHFSELFLKNEQITFAMCNFLENFKFYTNNVTNVFCSKSSNFFSKLWQKQFFLNNLFPLFSKRSISLLERRKTQKNDKKSIGQSTFLTTNYDFQLCDLFLNSKFRYMSSSLLHPKLITRYIFSQFEKTSNLKNNFFIYNLKTASLFTLRRLVQRFQNEIFGIKISCSGKWKKTRSGRKQSFTMQLGQIPNSSISYIVFFDQITQKTKFGCFSVKVWLFLN
jgi:hypothetical protein